MVKQGKKTAAIKFDRAWFDRRLKDREVSQRQLAKHMGCDAASINRLWNGLRPLRTEEAAGLASVLNVSVSEIFSRAGVSMEDLKRPIPIVGHIDGTGHAHINWQSKAGPAPAMTNLPMDTVAARMQTAASTLDVFDGFTVYFAPPRAGSPDAELIGRLCVAKVEGADEPVLRSLRRGYKSGTWNLSALCSPAVTNVALEWATPVLLMRPPSMD